MFVLGLGPWPSLVCSASGIPYSAIIVLCVYFVDLTQYPRGPQLSLACLFI